MTTINELKKILFDQKDLLSADQLTDNKTIVIIQDCRTPVPGRTIPDVGGPVYPVRRISLGDLKAYIGGGGSSGSNLPVVCCNSIVSSIDGGDLKFSFELPVTSQYSSANLFKVVVEGPGGSTFTLTCPGQQNGNNSSNGWITNVNLPNTPIQEEEFTGYVTGSATDALAVVSGLGISSGNGWQAYLWMYPKTL